MSYGYTGCMEAAGATIHSEHSSGDYQGTSIALVTYKGKSGFVSWSYGSCGGCDSYQAWRDEKGWDHEFTTEEEAEFGRGYLEHIMTFDEAEKMHQPSDWDMENDLNEWIWSQMDKYMELNP